MSQLKNDIATAIIPAALSALLICVVRFFVIPWSIWKGAALRLADMRKQDEAQKLVSSRSEFPVFDWLRAAWDGLIFLSWFIGAILSLVAFFAVAFSYFGTFVTGLSAMISTLITTYFSVIFMSLAKESLIIILSIALNVERLAQNKRT
ncbi:hypothetical protein [Billgrantia aerodenitrificans]|uniref:DUF2721 domain-containing protein n=1 Tax=Billgrantia aerodenitrificans TaxID=2733483 RepID=A0ABS9AW54_9GAMM|nr:hypothetical protein [Halomonas aerodenitrificans]MCE8025778.1 hypothetical protein [Halomonas aerodenitrificans]